MQSRNYIVFEVYYKHGEYRMSNISSISELISYIENWYKRYEDYLEKPDFSKCFKKEEEYYDDFDDILYKVKKDGENIIQNENGYGIVEIVEL